MKFILISPKNRTVYNFRGELIKEIINKGYEVVVTGPNQIDVDKIEELGAKFVEIPMNKNGVNPVSDLKYLKSLISLFKKEKPDVTLGYTVKPVIYGSIAAKIAKVKKRVAMITGAGYTFTAKTPKARAIKLVVSLLYKIGLSCADIVIFQNPDDRDQFVGEHLLKSEKCRIVSGSGVNTEKFALAAYPKQLTFFMLSRVMYSKGIREYLEAAAKIKAKYPQVRFMLLGAVEGIQDSLQQAELDAYTKNGIVEHFGETDTVADYYQQCSVYVLPSYREGTPRTVLEAMAMGRAIITTDASYCRETVRDNENGFLVPVKDSNALAEKMEYFIENPDEVMRMGAKSRAYCIERFDVNKVNSDMLGYLNITTPKGEKGNVIV